MPPCGIEHDPDARIGAAAASAATARVASREPSSTTMHSQRGSVWRARLRRHAGSVAAASRAGSSTETQRARRPRRLHSRSPRRSQPVEPFAIVRRAHESLRALARREALDRARRLARAHGLARLSTPGRSGSRARSTRCCRAATRPSRTTTRSARRSAATTWASSACSRPTGPTSWRRRRSRS